MKRMRTHIVLLFLGVAILLSACTKMVPEESVTQILSMDSSDEPFNPSGPMEMSMPDLEIDMEEPYMKAVWLSQYDLLSLYSTEGQQRPAEHFTTLMQTVLDNIVKEGFDTVIVQIRPFGDSMYPSEYFPTSSYVSGSYGKEMIYDPFAIIVELAKERELDVHGWINPLRAMKPMDIEHIADSYIIKQWYDDETLNGDYLVEVDGRLYLNPAYQEVRNLIVSGAREICQKYDISGIHMDDYFYPTTDASFDRIAYTAYKNDGGTLSLADFRYENINSLVRELYSTVKSEDEALLFGISPMGNLQTSYTTLYTDVYTWCKEDGYIDYICPQIYFGLEHQTHDFKTVYQTWKTIIKNENVKLVVGMTFGKAQSGVDNYAGTGKTEWAENKDVLKRCLEYLNNRKECQGVVFFCYQYMYDPITGQSVSETAQERENMKEALEALGKK